MADLDNQAPLSNLTDTEADTPAVQQDETPAAGLALKTSPKTGIPGMDYSKSPVTQDIKGSEELLNRMQAIADARKPGIFSGFQSAIDDMVAHTGRDPTARIAAREQMKRENAQADIGLQGNIASMKAAIEQQKQFNARRAAAGAGGLGAGASFGGVTPPPAIQQALNDAQTKADYDKIFNAWAQSVGNAQAQGMYRADNYTIPAEPNAYDLQGNLVKARPIDLQTHPELYRSTVNTGGAGAPSAPVVSGGSTAQPQPTTSGGVNQFNVGNVRPAGQSTGFQQPTSYEQGLQIMDNNLQSYAKKGINTLGGVISTWSPSNENDTQALIKTASQRLGIKPDQQIDLTNPVVRHAIGTALMLQEKGPQGIFGMPQANTAGGLKPVAEVIPPPKSTGNISVDQENFRLWKAQNDKAVEDAALKQKELTTADVAKEKQYLSDIGESHDTYDTLSNYLDATKGHKNVFNLSGQGLKGPLAEKYLVDKTGKENVDVNKELSTKLLNDEDQTHFRNAKQGVGEVTAVWAKNLVKGAGGRLTNADLNLGQIVSGVGPDNTYEGHMQNLARSMEIAKTVEYRGDAFKKWKAEHPSGTTSDFEQTPYYKIGSKLDAARDVAGRFKDIPESKFVHPDTDGKMYYIVGGKRYYL